MSPGEVLPILVVDDNPATRYATSRVLRAAGFPVTEAASGREAVVAASHGVELVVLDVNLPDIDGFQVCRLIRANPLTARTPVVHLSATFVNDAHKVQGLEAGADGYMTHPVEPPVLVATIRAFIRKGQAEIDTRESEAKFKAIFDHALNGIALIDPDLIVLDVNEAFASAIRRTREQVAGKHMSALCPAGYEPVLGEMALSLGRTGAWRSVMPLLRSDGTQVELDWQVSIHANTGIRFAITTDVTGRKEAEAERERLLAGERAARADAERANRLKDDFLALLSHELRTPLNSIVGWSAVARKKIQNPAPEVAQALEAIERNARVQAKLISDLLDISRITAGKIALNREWFDPGKAVEAALESLSAAMNARNVTVEHRLAPSVAPIFWDPARFQQVVWNLVDNAVKFSAEGSSVEVSLRQSESRSILSVKDDGQGISADFLPHVFDRFRQQNSGTRRGHGGLGLGLAIVKQIVEGHGGTIVAESEGEGMGTRFSVFLPRLEHVESPATTTAMTEERPLNGSRVLVVEDDLDSRAIIQRVLDDAGADVLSVESVSAAFRVMHDFNPDLIVSDIGMPFQDGYDLIRRVREAGYEKTPAIALTAFARGEDRERALKAGYQEHLTKPLDATTLVKTAHQLLTNRSPGNG